MEESDPMGIANPTLELLVSNTDKNPLKKGAPKSMYLELAAFLLIAMEQVKLSLSFSNNLGAIL